MISFLPYFFTFNSKKHDKEGKHNFSSPWDRRSRNFLLVSGVHQLFGLLIPERKMLRTLLGSKPVHSLSKLLPQLLILMEELVSTQKFLVFLIFSPRKFLQPFHSATFHLSHFLCFYAQTHYFCLSIYLSFSLSLKQITSMLVTFSNLLSHFRTCLLHTSRLSHSLSHTLMPTLSHP